MKKNVLKDDDDDAVWPHVPYHYGMGRIKEYESWLASLDEDQRNKEIESAEKRTNEAGPRAIMQMIFMKDFSPKRPPALVRNRGFERERER